MVDLLEKVVKELKLDKANWLPTKFGDVALQQKQKVDRDNTDLTRYVKGEHMGSEDLHLRSWGELQDEYLGPAFIRRFDEGDILYGSRRTYLRKVVIAPFEGITSNTTFVIAADEEKIDKRLLPFIMMSEGFTENSIRNSKGSVNPYINWKDIAKYEFLLPPKDQQAQLAELLWAMDEVIERGKTAMKSIKKSRQAYFKHLVKAMKGSPAVLNDVLIPKNTKSAPPHALKAYIGLEHVQSGAFKCDEYADPDIAKAQCSVLRKGDLCYSKLRPYLDKAFIADFDAVSTTEILVYDTEKVSKEYALNILHSPGFLNYVADKGFGTKMPRVNHKIIGGFPIRIIEQEDALLEQINKFHTSEEKLLEKQEYSKSLQKSLINQIF